MTFLVASTVQNQLHTVKYQLLVMGAIKTFVRLIKTFIWDALTLNI